MILAIVVLLVWYLGLAVGLVVVSRATDWLDPNPKCSETPAEQMSGIIIMYVFSPGLVIFAVLLSQLFLLGWLLMRGKS